MTFVRANQVARSTARDRELKCFAGPIESSHAQAVHGQVGMHVCGGVICNNVYDVMPSRGGVCLKGSLL